MYKISIAKDFSETPGARYKDDGPFSGEEFREIFLEPLFENPDDNKDIIVILDGVEGYATSFLDEAFGGIARKYGVKRCLKRFKFISKDVKLYVNEIISYIKKTNEK